MKFLIFIINNWNYNSDFMSLVVWLPLNGNLNNQGISGVTVTNGGMTVNDSGKIGKCYSFANSNYLRLDNMPFSSLGTCSVSFWWYLNSTEDWLPCTGQSGSYYFMATSGGTGGFYHQNVGSNTITIYRDGVQGTTPLGAGAWHHYVITGLNLTSWTAFYINMYGSTGSSWNSTGRVNDFRIYDHNLSLKEIKEISKGLVLHYKFNDAFVETYQNVARNDSTWPGFGDSFYNGAVGNYGYNTTSTNVYRTSYDEDGIKIIKVYPTSGASVYPYVFFDNITPGSSSGMTKTLSFDIFPHGSSRAASVYFYSYYDTPCTYVLTNTSTGVTYSSSTGTTGTSTLPLNKDQWNHIVLTLTTTSSNNGAGWGYTPLNGGTWTADGNEYWLFKNIQITTKSYDMPYIKPGTTNTGNTVIYDCSGYRNDGTAVATLTMAENSPRYNKCICNTSEYPSKTVFSINNPITAITISCWIKLTEWGTQTSGIWATSTDSTTSPGDYYLTTCNHRDSGFDVRGTNGTTYRLSCDNSHIPLNAWKHVVFRHDGTNLNLFINGELKSTTSCPTSLVGFKSLFIGYSYAGGAIRKCKGYWSDFRMYVTALSNEDILELYHTAGSIDKSGTIFTYDYNESSGINKLSKSGILYTNTITEDTGTTVRFKKGSSASTGQIYANQIEEI